tara:strand:+ start:677 stop:970 length:294 start_codon:yes stop_codon:yes gene_type:complete
MSRYEAVTLLFNEDYGSIKWSDDFRSQKDLLKLNLLQDWIHDLQNEFNVVLGYVDGDPRYINDPYWKEREKEGKEKRALYKKHKIDRIKIGDERISK